MNLPLTLCFTFVTGASIIQAQSTPGQFLGVIPDTIFAESFEMDPTALMEPVPSGNDLGWVNFDGDELEPTCNEMAATPFAWYQDRDFSNDTSTNSCFTACSYYDADEWVDAQAQNWLIMPPLFIPNAYCKLRWKSLSFSGPSFLDGYKVLVAKGSNDIFADAFTDTLFSAASMISCTPSSFDCGSTNLSDYTFTPGYIHANSYTDSNYFYRIYLGNDPNGIPFYTNNGILEPHETSLAAYAGQTIYIAFLHDANNNYLLQVDDILVVDEASSAAKGLPELFRQYSVAPNPVHDETLLRWTLDQAMETRLELRSITGQLLHSAAFTAQEKNQYRLDTRSWQPGVYLATLITEKGIATRQLIRM